MKFKVTSLLVGVFDKTKTPIKEKKMKKCLLFSVVSLGVLVGFSQKSYALFGIGDIVYDPTEIAQTVLVVAKQVMQYALQMKQYENMLQNTLSFGDYIWAQPQYLMQTAESLDSFSAYYGSTFGSLNGYLGSFQNLADFSQNACYTITLNNACMQTNFNDEEKSSALQTNLNAGETRMINQQKNAVQNDAMMLEQLKAKAQSSGGQMQALQTQNMIAHNQASQILQLRRVMLAKYAAEAHEREEETKEKARAEAFARYVLTPEIKKMPHVYWK